VGWTNENVNELVIGQSPTEIVLSTQLPAALKAFYGPTLKSGILFYWNPTDYFYMVNVYDSVGPLEEILFGMVAPSQGLGFTSVMRLLAGPAGSTVIIDALGAGLPSGDSTSTELNIDTGAVIHFHPWNNAAPTANTLYVDAAGVLRYQGGATNTPIAPN
jgi:hypothetical protein